MAQWERGAGRTVVERSWWDSGGDVSHHCDWGSTPAPCICLIEVTLVMCGKSVVQFDSTEHRRFSPGTPVSSSNTGPMRDGPY